MSNKWFTAEYIELCKNLKLQKLVKSKKIHIFSGDQLDEEIIKICKKKDWDTFWYTFEINWHRNYTAKIEYYNDLIRVEHLKNQISSYEENSNPLICKLKLLLELLIL